MTSRSASVVIPAPIYKGGLSQTPLGNRARLASIIIPTPVYNGGLAQTPVGNRARGPSSVYYTAPPKLYKNQGWYAAGSVYETWISNDSPNTTPPSGHTLTQIQHIPLQSDMTI